MALIRTGGANLAELSHMSYTGGNTNTATTNATNDGIVIVDTASPDSDLTITKNGVALVLADLPHTDNAQYGTTVHRHLVNVKAGDVVVATGGGAWNLANIYIY